MNLMITKVSVKIKNNKFLISAVEKTHMDKNIYYYFFNGF